MNINKIKSYIKINIIRIIKKFILKIKKLFFCFYKIKKILNYSKLKINNNIKK